jgi:hypothetical protein
MENYFPTAICPNQKFFLYTKTFPNHTPAHLLVIIYLQRIPEANMIKVIFPASYCFYAESAFITISTDDHNQNDLLPQSSAKLKYNQHSVINKMQTYFPVAMHYVYSG